MGGCLGKEVSHSTCTDKLLSHVSPFHVFLSLPSRAACITWRSLLILSISRSFCVRPPKALYSTVVPSARPYLQGNGREGGSWLITVSCTSRANRSLVTQESCIGLQEQSNKQSGDWCSHISG